MQEIVETFSGFQLCPLFRRSFFADIKLKVFPNFLCDVLSSALPRNWILSKRKNRNNFWAVTTRAFQVKCNAVPVARMSLKFSDFRWTPVRQISFKINFNIAKISHVLIQLLKNSFQKYISIDEQGTRYVPTYVRDVSQNKFWYLVLQNFVMRFLGLRFRILVFYTYYITFPGSELPFPVRAKA